VLCGSGFHACENPLDVWRYYDLTESRFAEVELRGDTAGASDDTKIAAAEIYIRAELTRPQFIKRAVDYVIELCKSSGTSELFDGGKRRARIGSSGNYARIGSSGDGARIEATGKNTVVACSGSVRQFKVGPGACVSIPWHDGKRTRFAVGYEGENLKAGITYTINGIGEFEEVE